jgi:hypothetical protein
MYVHESLVASANIANLGFEFLASIRCIVFFLYVYPSIMCIMHIH